MRAGGFTGDQYGCRRRRQFYGIAPGELPDHIRGVVVDRHSPLGSDLYLFVHTNLRSMRKRDPAQLAASLDYIRERDAR
ncbi:MAG TPA: hypothetical protein VIK54_05785 [Acidimicrobiia bacterium]